METTEYVLIDTQKLKEAIEQKEEIIKKYTEIEQDFSKIVEELTVNWKGKGADAFVDDVAKVRRNLTGIYDILTTMCDTLTDCRTIFCENDAVLGEFNSNPFTENE